MTAEPIWQQLGNLLHVWESQGYIRQYHQNICSNAYVLTLIVFTQKHSILGWFLLLEENIPFSSTKVRLRDARSNYLSTNSFSQELYNDIFSWLDQSVHDIHERNTLRGRLSDAIFTVIGQLKAAGINYTERVT